MVTSVPVWHGYASSSIAASRSRQPAGVQAWVTRASDVESF